MHLQVVPVLILFIFTISCFARSILDSSGGPIGVGKTEDNSENEGNEHILSDNLEEEERIALFKELVGEEVARNASSLWGRYLEVKNYFPFYKTGYDRDGLAVYVAEFGKWDFAGMAEKPENFQNDFWKYSEKQFQLVDLDAKRHNSQGVVLLVDYDGFGLRSLRSATALEIALKVFNRVVRFNNNLKYGFIINLDFVSEIFMNAGRPLVGEILEKFETFGTLESKWKPALLRKIPSSQLPPKYGGAKTWKPPIDW